MLVYVDNKRKGWHNASISMAYKNSYNARGVRADNKVGVPGIYYHKGKRRYHATITVHTRRIHLGWFVSLTMAIKVRKSAEEKFLGMIE